MLWTRKLMGRLWWSILRYAGSRSAQYSNRYFPCSCHSWLIALGILLRALCISSAVSPACDCVFFDGFGYLSNGTFTSPNFPLRYEQDIHCILYTFVGRQGELIALTFNYFELQKPDEAGRCSDYVKLYQDLEQPAVNEDSLPQETLCGHLPSRTFYSRGRALIFEFHTDSTRTERDKGFSGEFRFLRQREFQTDGEKVDPKSVCDYHIHSGEMKSGKIFSPDYPYFYIPNKDCNFWFTGRAGEHISITVVTVDLTPTSGSCVTAEDSVSIYDGPGPRLGHGGGPHLDLLLGHYCGKSFLPETVTTSGEFAFVRFKAGPNSKRQGRGFYATFRFYTQPPPIERPPGVAVPGGNEDQGMHFDAMLFTLLSLYRYTIVTNGNLAFSYWEETSIESPPCDYVYSSENHTHGEVRSIGYQQSGYPPNLRCTYTFRSTGLERVQIIFTDFDLYYPLQPDKPQSQCQTKYDHVTAYVDVNGRMSEINTFCSTEIPPQLMSSGNLLTLEFVTNAYPADDPSAKRPTRTYNGFRLLYRFVKDFGIRVGQRDYQYKCGFIYNSTVANNGTIYSPNYPGYYPRKLECHYTFLGAPGEKVRIFFTYFDVEGTGQCDNASSDYLEFSNYKTVDLKLPRYCGRRRIPNDGMESEKDFYHLTFSSNSIFDATGFFAFYQFVQMEGKAALHKVKLDMRGTATIERSTCVAFVLPFLCFIYWIFVSNWTSR